jgi:hypothetical protein
MTTGRQAEREVVPAAGPASLGAAGSEGQAPDGERRDTEVCTALGARVRSLTGSCRLHQRIHLVLATTTACSRRSTSPSKPTS